MKTHAIGLAAFWAVLLSGCGGELIGDTPEQQELRHACGNGRCGNGETCGNCPQDCGRCDMTGLVDTIAPAVAIASPVNGAYVMRTTVVKINAADDFGVTKVELYKDGGLFG